MNRAILTVVVLSAITLAGCMASPTTEDAPDETLAKIQWYDGEIEEAFVSAKDEGKPIFLYWGAQWCPPCHNLKNNTFTKPEFLEAIKAFVPVYLDGDTERAQLWGEKFKIAGYPTVILFSPTGVELFRMPSDVTPEKYGTILQAVVSDFRPVHQILEEVLAAGPGSSDTLDLELIAFHSWVQDPHSELTDSEAFEAFWKIYSGLPPTSTRLRARFMTLALDQAMPKAWTAEPAQGDVALAALNDMQNDVLRTGLLALLESPNLWSDNKIFLTLQSRRAIETLEPIESPERDALVESWLLAAVGMQEHPEFSTTEQLMAFVPEFELLSYQESPASDVVPASLQDKVRARVEYVVTNASDPGEFQSTLNMAVWLLNMAQLPEEAKAVLDQHADETAAPHYFQSLLGDLTQDNPQTALEWHRLAFERSGQGSARVKWGSTYIQKLIQLAPEDTDAIEAASRELIGVLAGSKDAFAGRNHVYLRQTSRALRTWADATENGAVIDRLRLEVHQQCDHFEGQMDPDQYERCMTFLSGETDPPDNH